MQIRERIDIPSPLLRDSVLTTSAVIYAA